MASSFASYGLIDTPVKAILYRNALNNKGDHDTREYHSSALYCALALPFFQEEIYAYCPEPPPAPHSRSRADHVHNYHVQGEDRLRPLLYVENKRAKSKKSLLEDQAEQYCKIRADHHAKRRKKHTTEPKLDFLYCVTVAGAFYKFWVYDTVTKVLNPLFEDSTEYLDPGADNDAHEITRAYTFIKAYPPFGTDVSTRHSPGEDHSQYSQGSIEPEPSLIQQMKDAGYLQLYHQNTEEIGGVVRYTMADDRNEIIMVDGDQWNRTIVRDNNGDDVDYCFTYTKGSGEKYFIWRLDEVTVLPVRLKPGEVDSDDSAAGSDASEITVIDTTQFSEVFFKSLGTNKEDQRWIRFSRDGKKDIERWESELSPAYVDTDGKRERCFVFEGKSSGEQYYCRKSKYFSKALETENKKKKGKGKGRR